MAKDIFKGIAPDQLKKRKKVAQPAFIVPMLATLTDNYFSNDAWFYEHKFDGERCLVFKKDGKVTLKSRNNSIKNKEYPELVKAFEQQKADNFIVDGEIISRNPKGVSDFQLLQKRINLEQEALIKKRQQEITISLEIFDIMYAGGYDLRELPLYARKEVLQNLLSFNDMLSFTNYKKGNGIKLFRQACKKHWEGLIVKKADSIYEGKRSPHWLKFKCIMKQELVIGGYTDPKGSRTDFGALLVGYYKGKDLQFAGKVGTGYSQDTLTMLGKKLRSLEVKRCPFENYDDTTKGIHWVKPQLVAEFQFANWTEGGKLRVGRYKGLRDDKAAKDVVQEVPKAIGPGPGRSS